MSEYYLPVSQILKPLQVGKYGALDRYRDNHYWLSTAFFHVYEEEIVDIPLLYAFPLEWKNGAPNYDDFVMQSTIKERVWVWYVDSVAGGKDMSGDGSKENPFRSINSVLNILAYLNYYNLCNNKCFMIKVKGVVDYDIENKECQCVADSGASCFRSGDYTKKVERNNGSDYLKAYMHPVWYARILLRGWTDEQRVKITGSVSLAGCTFVKCDFEIPEKGSIYAGSDVFVDCSLLSKEKEEVCLDAGNGGYRLFVENNSDSAFSAKFVRCKIYLPESVVSIRGMLLIECDFECKCLGRDNRSYNISTLFYKGKIRLAPNKKEEDKPYTLYNLQNVAFVGCETVIEDGFYIFCCSFLNVNISKISVSRMECINIIDSFVGFLEIDKNFSFGRSRFYSNEDVFGFFCNSEIKSIKSKTTLSLNGQSDVWLYEIKGKWTFGNYVTLERFPFLFEYKSEKTSFLGLIDFNIGSIEIVGELSDYSYPALDYGVENEYSFSCGINSLILKKTIGMILAANAQNINISSSKVEELEDASLPSDARCAMVCFVGDINNVDIKMPSDIRVHGYLSATMFGSECIVNNVKISGTTIDSNYIEFCVVPGGNVQRVEADFKNVNLGSYKIKSTFYEDSESAKQKVSNISCSWIRVTIGINNEDELSGWINIIKSVEFDIEAEKHVNSEVCDSSSFYSGYYKYLNGFEYQGYKRGLYGDGNIAYCRSKGFNQGYEWIDMTLREYYKRFYGT